MAILLDYRVRFAVFGGLTLALYLNTVCPAVHFWDTAEIISAAWSLGIPHPPGFPLYTLLGRVVIAAGILSPAISMNILSAFSGAGAVVLTLFIFRELENGRETIGGYLAAALFALGNNLWMQSVRAEVYAFNILLLGISLVSFFRFKKMKDFRLFIAGLYFWGLSAVTHTASAAASFIPFLILGLGNGAWKIFNRKKILVCFVIIILAFSASLYLPIRSSLKPDINWGQPTTFDKFWSMITAREFAFTINFKGSDQFYARMVTNWKMLSAALPLLPLIFTIAGIVRWRKKSFLILLFVFGLSIAFMREELPYPDHLGYLLLSAFVLAVWTGSGFNGLTSYLSRRKQIKLISKRIEGFISIVLIAIMIVPFFLVQYPRHNLRESRWADKLGRDIIEPLPLSSIVMFNDISSYFICRYLQVVEGLRNDCDIVLPGLLSGGSKSKNWYLNELNKRTAVSGLNQLPPSETGVIARIIEANHTTRPVYCEYGDDFRPFAQYLQPEGILFKVELIPDSAISVNPDYRFPNKIEFKDDRGAALAFAERIYAKGLYYLDIGENEKAERAFQAAFTLSGDIREE
ncbi:MAG: DUF2723 domain-containing protein [candidate division Zixibacteria bacterium]|nr:DUF2723 domain-containing protein [Candidatus Tariuqbacter arcticus]